jgi:dTDP-4-dehydrorhamnose reductase
MKLLITGANGQLGYHLKQVFHNETLYLGDTDNYDITDAALVLRETEQFQPDVIIHAAAYTNVDKAEIDRELCEKINVEGSRNVALAAKAVGAKLVAISTDYVFSGDSQTPYKETDTPNPVSSYGQTKFDGEKAVQETLSEHYICRTSWLYGGPKPTPETDFTTAGLPKNFVNTMLRVGKTKDEVSVVADQQGGPTYAHDLALKIKELIKTDKFGIYHITNSGVTNWADFATAIFKTARYTTTVKHVSSVEWELLTPSTTKRPAYSVLAHDNLLAAGLADTRNWQDALADYLSEM